MRAKSTLTIILLASLCQAAGLKHRQSGVLLQMDSVACDLPAQPARQTLLTTATDANLQSNFCQEYVLQTDRMTFHIRPKDNQKAVLLPVGSIALFRLEPDRMILRAADLDDKDREYNVISMAPRETPKPPETPLPKLNHLQ